MMTACIGALASGSHADIKVWHPLGYNKLDASGHRYFAVQTESYKFVYDLGHPGMCELYNLAKDPSGSMNLLRTSSGPAGWYVALIDGTRGYLSYLSNGNALVTVVKEPNTFTNMRQTRMSFRQAGRVYYQIDVTGIKLTASDGTAAPVTVKQRFHLWPEKFYVETSFSVEGDISTHFAEAVVSYDASRFTNASAPTLGTVTLTPGLIHYLPESDPYLSLYSSTGSNGSLGHVCVSRGGTDSIVLYDGPYMDSGSTVNVIHRAYDYDVRGGATTWHAGETHTIYSQMCFSDRADASDVAADGQVEASPLSMYKVTSSAGSSGTVSYDNTSGCYRVEIPSDLATGAVGYNDYADILQNHYETARIRITNPGDARLVRLKMVRGSSIAGSSPWGEMVVTDAAGFPIGVPTEQNSRWGGGELDAFFACYTSLPVEAGETKDIGLKIVSQNWGRKPIIRMQCQDLFDWEGGADEQQWMQSSIGQGESMVYHVQRVWCTVEDVRGLDSRMLGGSTSWRDNCGGWEFLKLANGARPDNKEFVYRRSGPNLFDFTMSGALDDGSMTSSVRVIAVPANEVTRTFFHVRYDVTSTVNLGSLPVNLRLFSTGDEWYGGVQYPYVAYTDATGAVVNQSAASTFYNRRIGGVTPWACTYGASTPVGSGGNRGFVLRSYKAMVNGRTNNNAAITMEAGGQTRLTLTTYSAESQLIAGDYFEFDLETVAYGTTSSGYSRMQTEASAFGAGKPSVLSAHYGTKVSDFPARIDIGADGYADFSITGGRDFIPVEVGGFAGYTTAAATEPSIEVLSGNVWVPVEQSVVGHDWWQTEYDKFTDKYSFVFALPTDGLVKRFRVSQTLNRIEAETWSDKSPNLNAYVFPNHVGGSYLAGAGDSPTMAGAWASYTVKNVSATARRFTPYLRYASAVDGAVAIEVNGTDQTGAMVLPSTGGANIWHTAPLKDLSLDPGANSVRVIFRAGGPCIDRIELRLDRPATVAADDAVPLRVDVPFNISGNIPTVCSVTMLNTGTSTWTAADGYGLSCDDEIGAATFRPVADSVGPGQSCTFTFTTAAPAAAVRLFQPRWQMKHQTLVFGTPASQPARSTDYVTTYECSRVLSEDIPVRMGCRETATISVTVRNNGTTTWTGRDLADPYLLARMDTTFGPSGGGQYIPSGVSVAPGEDFTFSFSIAAPSTPGVYSLRLRVRRRTPPGFGPMIVRQIEVVPDATPPSVPVVTDAGAYTSDRTKLTASWTCSDSQSGVAASQYAIGTSAVDTGAGYVVGWTDASATAPIEASGLSLVEGTTYYVYVRCRNGVGMWSPVGASDGITYVRAASMSDAKSLPEGAQYMLPDSVLTAVIPGCVFVEQPDRACAMRIEWAGAVPGVSRLVSVVATARGYVDSEPTATGISIAPGAESVARPVGLSNRSIGWLGAGVPPFAGADTRCMLVRTSGSVTYAGTDFFLIDDGSGLMDCALETGCAGIKVALPTGASMPSIGQRLIVTGIVRASSGRRWLMPRDAADVRTL